MLSVNWCAEWRAIVLSGVKNRCLSKHITRLKLVKPKKSSCLLQGGGELQDTFIICQSGLLLYVGAYPLYLAAGCHIFTLSSWVFCCFIVLFEMSSVAQTNTAIIGSNIASKFLTKLFQGFFK